MADLEELRNDILRQMYEEAEPGLDFDDVLENPDEYPDDWYSNHTLPKEREQEIFEEHIENEDLSQRAEADLHWSVVVNYGPSYPVDDDG